ncbi:MAG: M20/M25/M40 family metallo-hydrolase [Candidatus Omnitrophica bacterium]|nr:M20/M25/M40 family metallo-hydrolase [Candidatus Omnitrophota bacterium]
MNINRKKLLKEAKKLIRLRSVTTASNRAIAHHVGTLLKKGGFRVRYQSQKIGKIPFYNVIGAKGKGKRPLILMTHLDTVPPGPHPLWTKTKGNPWNPVGERNKIYGLGSADTKLDILSKIFASADMPTSSFKRPLIIVGTFGEERGLLGVRVFCKRMKGLRGIAFVGEPSELKWVHEHRGYVVLEISIPMRSFSRLSPSQKIYRMKAVGKSTHSSTPEKGRNAIRLCFDFLKRLSLQDPDPVLLFIEGGTSPNQVPAEAMALFAASSQKIPSPPHLHIEKIANRYPISHTVPWKALWELFSTVDRGIRRWQRPMTSNVGVIRVEGRFLKVLVDFRVHARDKNQEILAFFKKKTKEVLRHYRLRGSFRIERDGPSLSVSPGSPIIRLGRSASRKAGIPFRLTKKPSCTEAGYLWEKGIPALVFGAGKSAGNIHSPNEYNELKQLEKATYFYRALIETYCLKD